MSSIGSHSGKQRPVPLQQASLTEPVTLIFSLEYPATILTIPLTDHGVGTFSNVICPGSTGVLEIFPDRRYSGC